MMNWSLFATDSSYRDRVHGAVEAQKRPGLRSGSGRAWCFSLGKAAERKTVVSKKGFLVFTADYLIVFGDGVEFLIGVALSDQVGELNILLYRSDEDLLPSIYSHDLISRLQTVPLPGF